MRNWLFHPLLFYPLAILLAGLIIAVSLKPQAWPRPAAPVAGHVANGVIVIEGEGFTSPDDSPEQTMTVERDFWGKALSLHIAQLPGQPAPGPAEQGVRILLTPETIALIEDKPVQVEITYLPQPVNMASALAVSVQGIGPAEWLTRQTPPQPGTLLYDLPAQMAVSGIGLRAISDGADQAYGIEITRIRITPHP